MTTPISTEFTKLFGISSPIASAPMAYSTSPSLVASVIKAGGIGFLGAGNEPSPKLVEMIDQARAGLDANQQALVAMGFVGWVLDKFGSSESDPRLKTVLDKKVSGIWLAFGEDLGKYVTQIREHNKTSGHTTRILINVNTIEEAKKAANKWKADVVIIQGAEAGGRGSIHSPPTLDFLKQTVAAIPNGPPILAAGGVMKGSQMASLIEAGASGIVLGTRLLFTPECAVSGEMKEILLQTGPDSTSRSKATDILFPPGVWPDGVLARCVKNKIEEEFDAGLDPAERKAKIAGGDRDHLVIFAGSGVSEVKEIQPTETVVKTVHEEALASLKSSGSKLVAA
ncbi:inosine monophosphate dehydrogenase [Marasmius fiardii PR-910]|nr:inosine monophosphate dehydrogenase [Marasmius fiardii PR-910]